MSEMIRDHNLSTKSEELFTKIYPTRIKVDQLFANHELGVYIARCSISPAPKPWPTSFAKRMGAHR